MRKCVHNKMRGCRGAGKFFMLSSKFRANHREVGFYLHTFPRSNCVMRPFSKWCRAEFKVNPVQRKSDLIFTQSSPNVIMPKSSLLAPHPLRCSRRRAFGSLKTLFNPSRRISHLLCCGSLPLAFAGSSRPWESNFYSKCQSFSLHTSLAHSLSLELTVLGCARCFKRY